MSETIGIIIIITTFISGAAVFVSRLIIKTKERNFKEECDYTICEKYCSLDKINIGLNKDRCNTQKKLDQKTMQYNLLRQQHQQALKADRDLFADIIKKIE